MGVEGIKLDFYNYLLENQKPGEKGKKEEIGDLSDFSIFKYAKEFKEFLSDEYKVSSDILSMNISDILELNFKDGKIIKEDEGTAKTASESDSAKTKDKNNKENTDIIDVLNLMMEDEEFKTLFDEDNNGEISKDEFNNFLDLIKDLDENEKDISIDDLVKTADVYNEIEGDKDENENNTSKENNEVNSSGGSAGGGAGGVYGGGGSSVGGSSVGSSSDAGSTTPATDANSSSEVISTENYDGLSVEELQNQLDAANDSLTEATGKVTDAETAVTTARENAQQVIDDKFQAYKEAIDANETTKNEITDKLDEIKVIEDKIRTNNDLKKDYEEKKTNAEKNIEEQEKIIQHCTSTISTLEGKIAALRASLSSAEDEDKSSIEAQIAALEAQIQSLIQQKEAAETSKEQSEKEVQTYNVDIPNISRTIETDEQTLETLNTQLNEMETDLIGDGNTDYAKAKQAYEDAKAAYPETCKEAEDALTVARQNVTNIQTNIEAINLNLTIAMEEEAEKIEVETTEESDEFLDDLLELDGIDESEDVEETEESEDVEETEESEDVEETEESEDVEETEDSEDVEETEDSEDKKGKIDTLCEKFNMSRKEIGVYLKSIADANNLDVNEMYNQISEFLEETESLNEDADVLSQYGIDSERAERYLDKQEPNIDYNTENCINSAIKLFELNITSEDILHSDNPTVQQILESYNNLSPENFESEYLYEDAVRQVIHSIEYEEQLSTEDQIGLFKEIAKDHPDIVSTYLQSYDSYFINNSMTTLLGDENAELKDCLNLLSDLQDLCGDNYNIIDIYKEYGNFTEIGLELYKRLSNYEDLDKLKEYIDPKDFAKYIQQSEKKGTETKDLKELFTALSNIQPDVSNYEAYGLTKEKANELAECYNFDDPSWFNASTFDEMTQNYSEKEVLFILKNTFPDANVLITEYFRDKNIFSYEDQENYLDKLAEIYSYNITEDEETSTTSEEVETTTEESAPVAAETADEVSEEPVPVTETTTGEPAPVAAETTDEVLEEPAPVSEEVTETKTEEPAPVAAETADEVLEEPAPVSEEVTEPEFTAELSDSALAQEFLNAYYNLDKTDSLYTFNVQEIVNGIMFPGSIGNQFSETGTELSVNDQINLLKEISKENGDIVQEALSYDWGQFAENAIFQMASDDNCTIDEICQFKTEYEELVNGEITLEDKLIEDNFAEIVLSVYEKMETIDDFIKVNEFFNAEKLATYIQTNKSKEYETDCLRRLFVSLSNIQPDTKNCENYDITEEKKSELLEKYGTNIGEWFNGSTFNNLLNLPPNEALYVLKNSFPDPNVMITEYFRDKNIFSYEDQENYLKNLISIYSTYIQSQPPEPIIE